MFQLTQIMTEMSWGREREREREGAKREKIYLKSFYLLSFRSRNERRFYRERAMTGSAI